jgi:hypothetical protein
MRTRERGAKAATNLVPWTWVGTSSAWASFSSALVSSVTTWGHADERPGLLAALEPGDGGDGVVDAALVDVGELPGARQQEGGLLAGEQAGDVLGGDRALSAPSPFSPRSWIFSNALADRVHVVGVAVGPDRQGHDLAHLAGGPQLLALGDRACSLGYSGSTPAMPEVNRGR